MGKVSPKDGHSKIHKHKRKLKRSTCRYLKPGALAQLRAHRLSSAKSCTDLAKKRVAVFGLKKAENDELVIKNKVIDKSPLMLSPIIDRSPLMLSPVDLLKQSHLVRTPKTPHVDDYGSDSRLESLPMELLVKIICHLHHDQLRAVFHVSRRIRSAVITARQFYFNYTTPDRSRTEMLCAMTPRPNEHWPFVRGDGKGVFVPSPHTPKAPRHGPRPPSHLKLTEMKQITTALFQDPALPGGYMVPSVLSKPIFKTLASNRVLFYEDELCQAVAQNKLR